MHNYLSGCLSEREMTTTTEILVVECVESRGRKEERERKRVLRDFSSSHEKREDGKRRDGQQL